MIAYSSIFQEVELHQKEDILVQTWDKSTLHMTDNEYKKELHEYINVQVKYLPMYHLVNTLEFYFSTSVELQEWAQKNEYSRVPIYEDKLNLVAIVVSKDLFAQLAVEQTLDINKFNEVGQTVIRYFKSKEQAWDWLIKNKTS